MERAGVGCHVILYSTLACGFVVCLLVLNRLLYASGWPGINHVAQDDLRVTSNPSTSAGKNASNHVVKKILKKKQGPQVDETLNLKL